MKFSSSCFVHVVLTWSVGLAWLSALNIQRPQLLLEAGVTY